MYKSILLSVAKNDIREAALWYDQQKKGLGKKFTAIVRKKITAIRKNPFAYSIRYGSVRTSLLDVFPFMIHFTIDNGETIIVSAVLHTRRNPEIWAENRD